MPIRNRNSVRIIILVSCLIIGGLIFLPSYNNKPGTTMFRKPKVSEGKMTLKEAAGLLKTLESSDCAYMGRVGFTGEESIEYNYYSLLKEGLTDSSWLELSRSTNKNLRFYAFSALKDKNSSLYPMVKKELSNDTAIVCIASGCTSISISISNYIPIMDK